MFADFQPLNQPHITTFSGCMVSTGSESEYEKYTEAVRQMQWIEKHQI